MDKARAIEWAKWYQMASMTLEIVSEGNRELALALDKHSADIDERLHSLFFEGCHRPAAVIVKYMQKLESVLDAMNADDRELLAHRFGDAIWGVIEHD